MSRYIEKIEKLTVPVVPMRGIVAFPAIPLSFEVTRDFSAKACEKASQDNSYLFLVTQKDIAVQTPKENDLYTMGIVAKIKQSLKSPDGNLRILVEGVFRASVSQYTVTPDGISADVLCKTIQMDDDGGLKGEALVREAVLAFEKFAKYIPKLSDELLLAVKSIHSPGLLADFIASNILIKYTDKQLVLEEIEPLKRLELLTVILEKEEELLQVEVAIHQKVKAQIDHNQREYYLREQLHVIESELKMDDEEDEELEYEKRIHAAALPKGLEEKMFKELRKLSKLPFGTPESGVIRNYLDVCLDLPWNKTTKDRLDIFAAKKILDTDHDGLEKIKERILEFLAVKQWNPDLKNQILCLVGPPGVGKTSIGISIARAMKRKYVRISLGGVRDEADIRGHRKTYIGAMPGRIISAIQQAGSRNPLILLDEIDKLSHDAHGDPASALLEVLDGEQNKAFRDHFIEYPIDLSECLFIATANSLDTIPRPLIDRMEIIPLKIYTRHEKLQIAKNHLVPKQLKRHGLNKRTLKITEDALYEIIDFYTKEAGVRNLEREIASLCRKAAKKLIEEQLKQVVISAETIKDYLGTRKVKPDQIAKRDEIGVVNGLAYTEVGGDLLKIEAAVVPGSGKVELTGSLGDVMKESAKAAITYIRSKADILGIDPDFYKTKDIHIHVPEGAVPKDGPSAGVTMVTALTSALCNCPVRREIAMTGEVTIRGTVLAIGGLKEKTMAAYQAGIRTVLIPEDNMSDLEEIDPIVRENVHFCPCARADEVLQCAILFDEARQNLIHMECEPLSSAILNRVPEISDTVSISCNR